MAASGRVSEGPREGPKQLVLDTSVAAKFYLNEDLYERARELASAVGRGEAFFSAPSTIGAELWSALWRRYRRKELGKSEVRDLWGEFERDVSVDLYDPGGLAHRATEIAYETEVVVHDALFLVLAEALDTQVVTADERTVLKRLEGTAYEPLAVHLEDVGRLLPGPVRPAPEEPGGETP